MPQRTRCPHCKKSVQVPDTFIGKNVRCPNSECKKAFVATAIAVGVAAATPSNPTATPPAASTSTTTTSGAAETKAVTSNPTTTPAECPACKAPLLPGAISCMDCGYLIQGGPAAEAGGPQVLCTNPDCGVANPPGERNCQRCSVPLPVPPGAVLHNQYRIDKQLAIGGFGAVYLATDLKENRQVAIKDMICSDPTEFAIRLNFFRREAEILRALEPVGIVPKVYDFIQQKETAHLVLEFIRGHDLLQVMEKHHGRSFPLEQVIAWGKSICDVLAYMHNMTPPLIHRDLKPDNIMLLEDGQSIKLIDFGTARDLGRTHKERIATKTRVYTEGYAPPEQIIGKPEARSDLFALAGTLYHLASGMQPEGSSTARELTKHLAAGNGYFAADERWFYELVRINLAEDANDRYFSAREIKADLERKQVTREVSCPKCQTVTKVREPYCHTCAEPLTDPTPPCSHCGKQNRMGSRCCIHCGNRLR